MNAKMLKDELINEIRVLPPQDLRIVIQFVDFIKEREQEEGILGNKKLIKNVKQSQKDWKNKKYSEFINLGELKKKYHLK